MNRQGEIRINTYGSTMILTKYRSSRDVDVYFPEYNYTARRVYYATFTRGSLRCPYERRTYGIGYLGEGQHETCKDGRNTRVYDTWVRMLQRCYDPVYQAKHPTYRGCQVYSEWHNFQTFADWYEANYYEIPGQVMNLDKDILYKGNKIYSPGTCAFVSQDINKLFTKRDACRNGLPVGVTQAKGRNSYRAQCNINGEKRHLGDFSTEDEAFLVYKQFKEDYIQTVADLYKQYLPFNLYQAMMSYEVEIED